MQEAGLLRLATIFVTAATLSLMLFHGTPAEALAEAPLGDSAVVVGTGGSGVRIRSGPGLRYEILGVVPERTRVAVLNGPQSDGEHSWYQIERTDGARARLRGWAVATYLASAQGVAARQERGAASRSFAARVLGYTTGGQIGDHTASGTRVRWGVVSVDPRYVPLGSLLTIAGLEGVFSAEDTGSAIKGAMVDVWFPDKASAVRWGSQQRTVTVLREGH
jgi:3D (Asp-Asp-Asp) domain-containing protein